MHTRSATRLSRHAQALLYLEMRGGRGGSRAKLRRSTGRGKNWRERDGNRKRGEGDAKKTPTKTGGGKKDIKRGAPRMNRPERKVGDWILTAGGSKKRETGDEL